MPEGGAFAEESPRFEGPAEQQEARELQSLVESFVAGLEGRDLAVFEARFRQQLTLDGTAAALGLSKMQVRWAEKRVRAALVAHLKGGGYLERYGQQAEAALVLVMALLGEGRLS